jgi:hypothetical protein
MAEIIKLIDFAKKKAADKELIQRHPQPVSIWYWDGENFRWAVLPQPNADPTK